MRSSVGSVTFAVLFLVFFLGVDTKKATAPTANDAKIVPIVFVLDIFVFVTTDIRKWLGQCLCQT